MYKDRSKGIEGRTVASKFELGILWDPSDRKQINDALDKHLEKSSLSASKGSTGKDKDQLSIPSTSAVRHTGIGDSWDARDTRHNTFEKTKYPEDVRQVLRSIGGEIPKSPLIFLPSLQAPLEKYKNTDFGRCPRVNCSGQPCLPVGQSDILRTSTVKIYCPKCEDVYYPRSKYQGNIDGAYFGTTFPHLFLMTYPHVKPSKPMQSYVPKIFGFKIHKSAR